MKNKFIKVLKVYVVINMVLALFLLSVLFFPVLGDGFYCDLTGSWDDLCQIGALASLIVLVPSIIVFRMLISHIAKMEKLLKPTRSLYILLSVITLFSLPFFIAIICSFSIFERF